MRPEFHRCFAGDGYVLHFFSGPKSVFDGDVSQWIFLKGVCTFDIFYGSLEEMKGQLPEWYKAREEKRTP
jgi:hypothetical protein